MVNSVLLSVVFGAFRRSSRRRPKGDGTSTPAAPVVICYYNVTMLIPYVDVNFFG